MTVLRASAGDFTQAVKRSKDSVVIGKTNPATAHTPIVPGGKGYGFQLSTLYRELYFQQPSTPTTPLYALGFLGNIGRRTRN